MDHVPPDAPRPRLCYMRKRPDFDGYGFNLHAEKRKPGQFIGIVDEASPAEACGMKEGDRIVEVNGENISQENHKQVVLRIKANPNDTRLLVVDQETEEWYRKASIVVKGSLPSVLHMYSYCGEEEEETSESIAACSVPGSEDNFPPPLPTGSPPPLDEEANDDSSLASSVDKGTKRSDAVNTEDGEEEEKEELPPPPYPGELTETKAEQNENQVSDELVSEDRVGSVHNDDEILDYSHNGTVGTDEKNAVLESHQETKLAADDEEPEAEEEEPTYPSFVAHRVTNSDQNENSADDDAQSRHDERDKDEADKNYEVGSEETLTQDVNESPVPAQIIDAEDTKTTAEDAPSDAEETKDVPETEVKTADDIQQQQDDDGKSASVPVASAASPIPSEKSMTVSDPGSSPRSFSPSQEVPDAPEIVKSRKAAKWGGLDLNMTAREMRERINSKKKRDPRRDEGLDMRKKYQIIQTL